MTELYSVNNMPDSSKIDQRFRESLDRYVNEGILPGYFLTAVLENNLKESFARADEGAMDNLRHIVAYIYWEIPSPAQGSPERVAKWVQAFERLRG